MSFMVVTDNGVRVYAGDKGTGMPQDQADASATERNARAAELGVATRYTVAAFTQREAA